MSLFSGLNVFYPGRPPFLTVSELHKLCDDLRFTFDLEYRGWLTVELQYGEPDERAFDATHEVQWDATQTIGTLPLEEDRQSEVCHHQQRAKPWPELWPDANVGAWTVHRAHLSLGALPTNACRDLTAHNPDAAPDTRSYIVPDMMSVAINPVYAETLSHETSRDVDTCYGFLGLSFSGNGYFTWQPLDAYWRSAGHTATMQTALRLCREAFPVPADRIEPLKEALGERFLNRDEYQPGDWIVSVFETG